MPFALKADPAVRLLVIDRVLPLGNDCPRSGEGSDSKKGEVAQDVDRWPLAGSQEHFYARQGEEEGVGLCLGCFRPWQKTARVGDRSSVVIAAGRSQFVKRIEPADAMKLG